MEYTFRNSSGDEMTVIKLSDYDFTLSRGSSVETIPYAAIVSIRITRTAARAFRMYVQPDNHSTIMISSLSFNNAGIEIDQSREYALLVRILHHHLKDKSSAVFSSGGNSEKIWIQALICVLGSFLFFVSARFLGFEMFNPYLSATVLSIFGIVVVFVVNAGNMPKTYEPAEIPLRFLP